MENDMHTVQEGEITTNQQSYTNLDNDNQHSQHNTDLNYLLHTETVRRSNEMEHDQSINLTSLTEQVHDAIRTMTYSELDLADCLQNAIFLINKHHNNNQQPTYAMHDDNEQQSNNNQQNSYSLVDNDNVSPEDLLNQDEERVEEHCPMYDNFLQWNVNGFWTRYEDLKLTIERWKPVVICLQETHLQPTKTVNLSGYNGYFNSVSSRKHGVAVFVRQDVNQEELFVNTTLNVTTVQVGIKKKTTFASIYIPPGEIENRQKQENTANKIKHLMRQLPQPFVLMGDFNAHNERWGDNNTDNFGELVEESVDSENAVLLNTGEKTHISFAYDTEQAIDLTIASTDITTELEWFTANETFGSDHIPIIVRQATGKTAETKRTRWLLNTADWEKYRQEIAETLRENSEQINIETITSTILTAAENNIKRTKEKTTPRKLKWMNPDLRELIRKRRKAEKVMRTRFSIPAKIEYKRLRAKVKYELKKARRKAWEEFASTITPQTPSSEIWNKMAKISGKAKSTSINRIRRQNGDVIENSKEIANEMVKHFAAVSSDQNYNREFINKKQQEEEIPFEIDDDYEADYNETFTEQELEDALNTVSGTSPGPDNIEYELIKQLGKEEKQQLLKAFNNVWTSGNFPDEWRNATVVPIKKPGKDPEQISSYRPISLTSCMCKIMERMVNKRLVWYLETNQLLSNQQYGFRKGRSTTDVLNILQNDISETIGSKHFMALLSLDLKNAYDRCWRRYILNNMKDMAINGRMLRFSSNFMTGRSIRVAIGNTLSEPQNVENGVPQGAVISVTMFLIAIDPITKKINNETSMIGYADDWAIYASAASPEIAVESVQSVANEVTRWMDDHGFLISTEKTKTILFHHKKIEDPNFNVNITINTQHIENVETHRILGLIFDKRLKWEAHIMNVKQRAQKKVDILKCLARTTWGADQDVLLNVNRATVLGTLRYGETAYGSATDRQLAKLEIPLNKGLRVALGAFCVNSTEKLLLEAGYPKLARMRELNEIKTAIKITSNSDHPLSNSSDVLERWRKIGVRTPRPLTHRARVLMRGTSLDLDQVEKQQKNIIPPWENISSTLDTDMLDVRIESSEVKRRKFDEMMGTKYIDHVDIYTDGSKDGPNIGFAVVRSDQAVITQKLDPASSIYAAELNAIEQAIVWSKRYINRFVICSDSLSAIEAARNPQTKEHGAVRLRNLLYKEKSKVKLLWTPGHAGIAGNESADIEAKKAANVTSVTTERLSIAVVDIVKTIENTLQARPNREKLSGYTRNEQVAISRLRMGYTRKSHKHRVEKTNPPLCRHCGETETVEHVIWECVHYEAERRTSGIEDREEIWNREQADRILTFAKKIDYLKYI
jgi:ribonuclease HI